MLKGNKGEWSEFYAFMKILSEGKLFAADKNIEKIPNKYFDVLKIVRADNKHGKKTYDISDHPEQILIFNENGEKLDEIEKSSITAKVQKIFHRIKSEGSKGAFGVPEAEEALNILQCHQITADNKSKSDLFLMIYDRISPTTPDLGFSIKSQLGSASTLFNAAQSSNLTYKLNGRGVDISSINAIGGKSKLQDKIKAIESMGNTIDYFKVASPIFNKNLRVVDSLFPEMIAEVMKAFYQGHGPKLSLIVDYLDQEGILEEKFLLPKQVYIHKIKNFLINAALGMTSSIEWDTLTKADGGYIIVKSDGELVCYHLYNRDEFQEYLFQNTKLETSSTGRNKFGTVYQNDNEYYINLNLQIRFIK